MANSDTSNVANKNGGWLGWIERVGNKLPDPATLFLIGTVLVMIASAVGTSVSLNSSNGHKTTIDDLEPGIYEICFSVNGEDAYKQCFEVKIIEPAPLASSSKVN